jgi:hypothetical protein
MRASPGGGDGGRSFDAVHHLASAEHRCPPRGPRCRLLRTPSRSGDRGRSTGASDRSARVQRQLGEGRVALLPRSSLIGAFHPSRYVGVASSRTMRTVASFSAPSRPFRASQSREHRDLASSDEPPSLRFITSHSLAYNVWQCSSPAHGRSMAVRMEPPRRDPGFDIPIEIMGRDCYT